jgi:hypothetical protein
MNVTVFPELFDTCLVFDMCQVHCHLNVRVHPATTEDMAKTSFNVSICNRITNVLHDAAHWLCEGFLDFKDIIHGMRVNVTLLMPSRKIQPSVR